MMTLENIGFSGSFVRDFKELDLEGAVPGRVIRQSAFSYRIQCEDSEMEARAAGKLKADVLPAVGDWVAVRPPEGHGPATILAVLPRRSAFSRNAPGRAVQEQVVAANIDEVFVVTDPDNDFNLRRLERYITLVYNSGAEPVIVLNKADRVADVEPVLARAGSVSPGIPVYAVSAVDGKGLDQLRKHLRPGGTVAFLGSSGVGKSTLINRLLGEDYMDVGVVREGHGKGRHTTSHRELLSLPGGGAVVDTPGMREIRVWGDEEGLTEAFPEVDELARQCRFNDCRHESEEGCAVKEALASGLLDASRAASFMKLRGEFENLEQRRGPGARREEKRRGKRFAKMVKEVKRHNPKRKDP